MSSPTPTLKQLLDAVVAGETALSNASQLITNDSNELSTAQADQAVKQSALDASTATVATADAQIKTDSATLLTTVLELQGAVNALATFLQAPSA